MNFLGEFQDVLVLVAQDLPGGLIFLYAFLLAGCISVLTGVLKIIKKYYY
ncbi:MULTISPECIES: hypothetical protein [Delftia]|jgi:hypothetical protein|nr:hypothetical protein [Delftia sp. K82]